MGDGLMDLYRVGTSVGKNIYIQTGKAPSKDDRDIGRMDTPEEARRIVALANKGLAAQRADNKRW